MGPMSVAILLFLVTLLLGVVEGFWGFGRLNMGAQNRRNSAALPLQSTTRENNRGDKKNGR